MTEAVFKGRFLDVLRMSCMAIPISDRIQVGMSDIYALYKGKSIWIELKIVDWDKIQKKKMSSKLLSHEFSMRQLAFLQEVRQNDGYTFCAIGYKRDKRVYAKYLNTLTTNITVSSFLAYTELTIKQIVNEILQNTHNNTLQTDKILPFNPLINN